jgi:hypothetical protein
VLIAGVIAQLEKDWDEPRHANLVERLVRSPAAFASTSGAPISPIVVGVTDLEQRNDDVRAVMEAIDSHGAVLRSLGATCGRCATVPHPPGLDDPRASSAPRAIASRHMREPAAGPVSRRSGSAAVRGRRTTTAVDRAPGTA